MLPSLLNLLFFTRCDVFCDLLQYTHTETCNLFVLYNKNSSALLKDFWGHEKRKTSLLTWIWCHLCVCPLIDHGQQPMKIPTSRNYYYCYYYCCISSINFDRLVIHALTERISHRLQFTYILWQNYLWILLLNVVKNFISRFWFVKIILYLGFITAAFFIPKGDFGKGK